MPLAVSASKLVISAKNGFKLAIDCLCKKETVDRYQWRYLRSSNRWSGPSKTTVDCDDIPEEQRDRYVWTPYNPCFVYFNTKCGCGAKEAPDPLPQGDDIEDAIESDDDLSLNQILDYCNGCESGTYARYVFEWVYIPSGGEWVGPTYLTSLPATELNQFPNDEWTATYEEHSTGCKVYWISPSVCEVGDPANDINVPALESSPIDLIEIQNECVACISDTYQRFGFVYEYDCDTESWSGPVRDASWDVLDCNTADVFGRWLYNPDDNDDFCRIIYQSECLCIEIDPNTIFVPPVEDAIDENGSAFDLENLQKLCCCSETSGNLVREAFIFVAEEPDEPGVSKWNFDRVEYTDPCLGTTEGEYVLPTEASPCELKIYGADCYCDDEIPSTPGTPPSDPLGGISDELCFPGGVTCDPLPRWRLGTAHIRSALSVGTFYSPAPFTVRAGFADDIHGASNAGEMFFDLFKVQCEDGVWVPVSGSNLPFNIGANDSAWTTASIPLEATDGLRTGWAITCGSGSISFAERDPDYCPGHSVSCGGVNKGGCTTSGAILPPGVPKSLEYNPVVYLDPS